MVPSATVGLRHSGDTELPILAVENTGVSRHNEGMNTRLTTVLSMSVLLAALVGCGSSPVYKAEGFDQDSPYQLPTNQSPEKACQAAQLALLSQGYHMESSEPQAMHAQKSFQPDDEVNATLDFFITCKATSGGSTVFATAVETTYELKKTSGSTGLSISGTSFSMPWSKSADSLVKVAGITIDDNDFYSRFFKLMGNYLPK